MARAFAKRRLDQYPLGVLIKRVLIVLSIVAMATACSDELRPTTPFGYYAPTERPKAERQPPESPNNEPLLEPWFEPSGQEENVALPFLRDDLSPEGRLVHVEGGQGQPGINGVGRIFRRRVIADEKIVGLHCLDAQCLAVSANGGVFRTTPFGDWYPLPSTLPALTRSFSFRGGIIACPASGDVALASMDRGRTWTSLAYSCGQNGRRTMDFIGDSAFTIVGQRIRVGHPVFGTYQMLPSPVVAPTALVARHDTLVVFGLGEIAISRDAGESFETFDGPSSLIEVVDAALDAKGLLAVAGRARTGKAPIAVSLDRGQTWREEPVLPDRSGEYHSVIIDKQRRIVASSHASNTGAIFSANMGRRWSVMESAIPLRGALATYRGGVLASTTRGIAVAMGSRGIFPMGLDQPLLDMLFIDPMRAVAIGVHGDLYRSVDAGHSWHAVPGTRGLPLTHLAEMDGVQIAIGPGVYRWSDSAGRTWSFGTSTDHCAPAWLVAKNGRAAFGCESGQVFISTDLGQSWREASASVSLRSAIWIEDGQYLLGLDLDGTGYFTSTDGGEVWRQIDPLSSEPIAMLSGTANGLAVVTVEGRIGYLVPESDELEWLTDDVLRRFVDVVQVRAVREGRLLVLDRHGLWSVEPSGEARRLASLIDGRAFRLVGDGGVVVLGRRSTTHLTRVRR